jgi:hypothetical protein
MLLLAASAAGIAIVVLTIAMTADAYGTLPASVPIHLSLDGTPDGYGPRPMAWLIVVVQLGCSALFAFLIGEGLPRAATLGRGHGAGMPIFAVCVLAALGRGQRLLLMVGQTGKPAPMRPFWTFFAAAFGIGIAALLLV